MLGRLCNYRNDYLTIIAIFLLFVLLTLTGTHEIDPSKPVLSRTQNGSALTGPVVFGVNQTVSIWCRANNTESGSTGVLRALFWRYPNGTRLPRVARRELSDYNVYRERFAGGFKVYTHTWWDVLHFSRIQPSNAGTYNCVANYNGVFKNESVDVQVSGVHAFGWFNK